MTVVPGGASSDTDAANACRSAKTGAWAFSSTSATSTISVASAHNAGRPPSVARTVTP